MTKTLPALLLAALLLPACGQAPLSAALRPASVAQAQAVTRATITGTVGDQAAAIRIADGAMRVTLGEATFEGTHSFFTVDGTLRAPGQADRALAVRMEGGKLVGEIAGTPLTLTVRDATRARTVTGTWGGRTFEFRFVMQPDARHQLRFEGTLNGHPAVIQGSGPWQGEQFAIYTSLFALLAAAP